MRRFFIAGAGLLTVITGASAQNAPPHAGHHPAEAPKTAPATTTDARHDCPMMKDDGSHRMGSAMHSPSPQMGQAHQMPDGMKHCSEMHGPAVPEKPQQPRQ
ncbi:hypothetical protein K426_26805 (plasmid) [Sphingobium sp. TKS]|nr:hypothetical protein K426_26805 [Sphingobium sp. TKS]